MTKRIRGTVLPIVLCCLVILCAFTGTARAVDLSWGNCKYEQWFFGCIMSLKSNEYSEDHPVIIFLPGVAECYDIAEAVQWMKNYHLYDYLDVDLITAAFWEEPLRTGEWENLSANLLEFVKRRYEESEFTVILDTVSSGGYGGCVLTQMLMENGIPVKELNLADACVPNYVTEELITEIAANGTQVNIWAGNNNSAVPEETRRIVEELEGTENVNGVLLDVWHGEVLNRAIYEYGLHSEYIAEDQDP